MLYAEAASHFRMQSSTFSARLFYLELAARHFHYLNILFNFPQCKYICCRLRTFKPQREGSCLFIHFLWLTKVHSQMHACISRQPFHSAPEQHRGPVWY